MEQIPFEPDLTPRQMLQLGVFGGSYFKPDNPELPREWVEATEFSTTGFNPDLNCFGVAAGQSRSIWKAKGWITPEDPLGWFQWYCRYFLGRRIAELDQWQIRRWKQYGSRTKPSLLKNCGHGDVFCYPKRRQSLLQWAYDPFI